MAKKTTKNDTSTASNDKGEDKVGYPARREEYEKEEQDTLARGKQVVQTVEEANRVEPSK